MDVFSNGSLNKIVAILENNKSHPILPFFFVTSNHRKMNFKYERMVTANDFAIFSKELSIIVSAKT